MKSSTKKDNFNTTLRPYQLRDSEDIQKRWTSDNAILYQLPTGGGKSVVATKIIWDHRDEKTLILAHRKELLVQMRSRLQDQGLKVGLIIRDRHEDLDANIIIASISTVSRDKRLDLILEQNFDNIIVDEAHRILTTSYDKVLTRIKEQNPKLKLLGLTATPVRRDKKSFNTLFNTLITSESTQSLIDAGYLANYRTYYTPTKDLDEEVQKYFNDYQTSSLSIYMRKQEMINYAVTSYAKLGEGKQAIVFCVDRLHAQAVTEAYKLNGYDKVVYLDGKTPERKRELILKDFEDQKITHIICIETLTEGVDLPETGCIQLLRPTLSLTLYLQMIGRGLRPKSDGSDLIILDNASCSTQFGIASSPKQWSLNPDVDPNEGRRRNKIVGKRRDGSFTDDEDEMEFLELVEMTPEEYIAQVANNIEAAEENNNKVDEELKDKLAEIAQNFIDRLKDKEDWVFIRPGSYIDQNQVTIQNKKFKHIVSQYSIPEINITLWNRRDEDPMLIITGNNHYYQRKEYFQTIAYMAMTIGDLYKSIVEESAHKKAIKLWDGVSRIQDKKIDLQGLRELINKAKEDKFEKQIDKYLETNTTLILSTPIREGDYFKGWQNMRIQKIEIPKGKIVSYTNSIILHGLEGWQNNVVSREKNYVKREKLYEMLKDGDWSFEVKQLETLKN